MVVTRSDSHSPSPPSKGGGMDVGNLLANMTDSEINKLSLHYGAELYSMVDEKKQKEISERNSAVRTKVKSLLKSKNEPRTKVGYADSYITLDCGSSAIDKSKKRPKGKGHESMRQLFGLHKLYSHPKSGRIPFIVLLDIELASLLEWLSPTVEERIAKEQVLLQLELVVSALFPNGKMSPFGSYVTGLSLPGGDVDVCIKVEDPDLCMLKMLVYALNRLELLHSFECIFNTAVPVVKIIDRRTGVKLDISMWRECTTKTTQFIKDSCRKYKYMQPLILLIKLFLQMRNLGYTYFGGVGSYLLYCMVLSFLQLHNSSCMKHDDGSNSLATLFIDFFYYWGFVRDYDQFVTKVRGFGHVYPRSLLADSDNYMFSCESPLDPSVDIGKTVRNMHAVEDAFKNAFIVLKNLEMGISSPSSRGRIVFEGDNSTILESLYDISHPIFQHRVKGRPQGTTHAEYFYDRFPSSSESLSIICKELIKVLKSNSIGSVFSAQRQLIGSLSQKLEGDSQNENDDVLPFYIAAEIIAQEHYNRN